jgi:hypothetical protein
MCKAGEWVCAKKPETKRTCSVSGVPCKTAGKQQWGNSGVMGSCGHGHGGCAAIWWHVCGRGAGLGQKTKTKWMCSVSGVSCRMTVQEGGKGWWQPPCGDLEDGGGSEMVWWEGVVLLT